MKIEPWVWTELLAFDSNAADCGVADYLATLGFVPQVACLLFSSPDMFLLHDNLDTEKPLSPLFCSRNAHPGNENRQRQVWTNFQLRKLIHNLKDAGCACYLSCFTVYYGNRYHQEWMSMHPEARVVYCFNHRGMEINAMQVLDDGTLVEDIIIPQVVKTCLDYGFAGWHGPDGWGPLSSGNLMNVDFSDGIMQQFLAGRDWQLPACITEPCRNIVTQEEVVAARTAGKPIPDYGLKQLQERGAWIWENHRLDWIQFNVQRWLQFWGKMTSALHEAGLKNAINSAWTKGNFDALYEYGIDYRKMAALGIDAMVVEAVALGMSQTRPDTKWYHDEFASALAEIKAAAPDFKLLFLHGIKDVVENWDNLRHATPGYERELFKLSNLYYRDRSGLRRCADGLLACLADGIAKHEWDFIRDRWKASFDGEPVSAGEATVLWHDAMLDEGLADFIADGFLPGQKQFAALLRAGLQLQTVARFENADCEPGAVFVPAAHLVPAEELDRLVRNHPAPVMLCGRAAVLQRFFCTGEVISDGRMAFIIAKGGETSRSITLPTPQTPYIPSVGELYFSQDRNRQAVAPELWEQAVPAARKAIHRAKKASQILFAEVNDSRCSLITRSMGNGVFDVAIENRAEWGRRTPTVTLSKPFEKLEVISSFPLRESQRSECSFTLTIPPRGISVVRVFEKTKEQGLENEFLNEISIDKLNPVYKKEG
jgi:hypothetical protein